MPTHKAIHICNSLKPTAQSQKLQKSMALPTLIDKRNEKSQQRTLYKHNAG